MSSKKPRKLPASASAASAAAPLLYDVEYIRSVASSQWPAIIAALTSIPIDSLGGNPGPCPWCGGTDRFRFSNVNGQGSCICNQCFRTGNGDGFAPIQRDRGANFIEVVKLVAEFLGIPPTIQGSGKQASKPNGKAAASGKPGKSPYGSPRNSRESIDPAESLEFHPWDEPFTGNDMQARVWCTWKAPITIEAIKAVGGRIARYQKQVDVIAIPVWGPLLDAAPPVGWCLYNLSGGTLPRKQKNKETGKWEVVEQLKVKLTAGSRPGIMADLARLRAGRVVVKVEGPSDCLGLLSLTDLPADYAAFTNANGAGELQAAGWLLSHVPGCESAVVIHDCDLPGQIGSRGTNDEKTGSFRPGIANYFANQVPTQNVVLPFPIAETHGNDLRDYLTLGSTEENPCVTPFADLLAIIEAAPLVAIDPTLPALASPATDSATDSTSPLIDAGPADGQSSEAKTVIEEDDDPHYLARVNLARYAEHTGGGVIRYWREQFYTWKACRASYRVIHRDEFSAKVTSSIKSEFDRQWEEAYALYREWCGSDSYSEAADKGPPKAKKVTAHLVKNVVAALASLTLVPSSVELSTWIEPAHGRLPPSSPPASPAASPNSPSPSTAASPIRERRPYVAMLNGLINISNLLDIDCTDDPVLPHSPNWFSTVRLPYNFEHGAECPRWLSFLNKSLENDPARIGILQEWAGYCLTPDTSYQKFLAMEGEGGNGKSVFMAGLQAMLGADNCSHIPLERFAGDSFDASETFGKLINVCADVGEVDKLAEGHLKSFTSGDVMSFKRKFLGNLTAKPTARLILSFNNRPRFSDRSQGVWRRMLLIPWRVQISPTERVLGMDSTDWWQQTGELPGIFNWALRGLFRLRAQKQFSHSDLVSDALQDYQDEANPVRTFLKENFAYGRGIVRCKDAYKFYADWAIESGHRPMNDRTFGKEFHRMFPKAERNRGGSKVTRYWYYNEINFSQDEINGKSTPKENLLGDGFDD